MMSKRIFIGMMGAPGAGKTDVSKTYLDMFWKGRSTFLNFADSLKEKALEHGWSGKKDDEGRAWLQDFSERYKKEHGEMVFYDDTMRKALETSDDQICIFGDVRFTHELQDLMSLNRQGEHVYIVHVYNSDAERRWSTSFASWFETGRDEFKWSVHRSELEWRMFVHHNSWYLHTLFNNDFKAGLEDAAQRLRTILNLESLAKSTPHQGAST